MPRLPIPESDSDHWGALLNDFLRVAHREDGTLRGTYLINNVRDFGAKGDNVADDTLAIQAAIDAVPFALPGEQSTAGGIVFFPPGVYRITDSLKLLNSPAGNYRYNIQLIGTGAGTSGFHNCIIVWDGSTNEPMVKLYSRDCIIRGLSFKVQLGKETIAAIDVDKDQSPQAEACTNNVFEYLQFNKWKGTMTTGVRIGQTAQGNVEYMLFKKCYFIDIDEACVNITSISGQSKHNSFYDCAFSGAQYGIKTRTGSFQTYNCSFGTLSVAINLGAITDNIIIQNSDSESCDKFLVTDGGSNGYWPVSIIGGRMAVNRFLQDGEWISFTDGGPLIIQNVEFEPYYHPTFRIRADTPLPGTMLISIGNGFPNDTPYAVHQGAQRRISLGNRGYNKDGFNGLPYPIHLDDEIISINGAEGKIGLSTVKAISGTQTPAHNLRGSVSIADTGTTGVVTFSIVESDANYFVSATVIANGTPAVGSTRAYVSGKSTSGFTINLEAAPGMGNQINVDWILIR